jgi:1-acyl-sn-glycerol-3-phosphate acyltransferase
MANEGEVSSSYAPAAARGPFIFVWGAIATLLSVIYTAILGPCAAIAAALERPHAVTVVSRLWGRLIIRTCGVKLQIEGLENLAGLDSCVLVSNHQSFFDIFAIAAFIPGEPRFVAKKELLKIPVVGYAINRSEHIVIDRQAGGRAIRHAIDVVRKGHVVSVFAEGHRYSDNRVHEFNDGGAWIAILSKVPVVPMSISGSGTFFPRKAMIVVPGGKMRIVIGKPIPTEGLSSRDRGELTARLEAEVRATFSQEL